MKANRTSFLLGVLGWASLMSFASDALAQVQVQPGPANPVKTGGEWEFDGKSWQFKEPAGNGMSGLPLLPKPTLMPTPTPVPSNGTTYPSVPAYPYVKPSPAVQITIGAFKFSFGGGQPAYGPAPPIMQGGQWLVTYKRNLNDPWLYHGFYASSSSAFAAANALSQQGFYAGVTQKN